MDRQLPEQLLRLVETLDEDQLHALYHVVVQRLQLAQKAHAIATMSQLHVLDRVSFVHNGKQYEGTVTRLNQKTIRYLLTCPANGITGTAYRRPRDLLGCSQSPKWASRGRPGSPLD